MKINVTEDYCMELSEVYSSITLNSDSGEKFIICQRDTGFEFKYFGVCYEAKGGNIKPIAIDEIPRIKTKEDDKVDLYVAEEKK